MKTRSTGISSIWVPGLSPMYSSMRSAALAIGFGLQIAQLRNAAADRHNHAGICSPGHKRSQLRGIDFDDFVVLRAGIGGQSAPVRQRLFPASVLGAKRRFLR